MREHISTNSRPVRAPEIDREGIYRAVATECWLNFRLSARPCRPLIREAMGVSAVGGLSTPEAIPQ